MLSITKQSQNCDCSGSNSTSCELGGMGTGGHPSVLGSYLIENVMYGTIFVRRRDRLALVLLIGSACKYQNKQATYLGLQIQDSVQEYSFHLPCVRFAWLVGIISFILSSLGASLSYRYNWSVGRCMRRCISVYCTVRLYPPRGISQTRGWVAKAKTDLVLKKC